MLKDNIVRNKFKKYFQDKHHKWYPSISIVPPEDASLLFTTAGMVQFKKQLEGEVGSVRSAASIQKCLRTSDIDEVGKTSRHLTFFEMYGNFSFGDYFKEEAIKWGWEFLTDEVKLSKEKLYATVFNDDDESYNIWKKYIPEEKIYRLGEEHNFWKMGETGPCGPCSEIIYDAGKEKGCGKADCSVGCDCDRFIEIWNLVFTQYNRQKDGTLKDLPRKNIDTGMGLERLNQVVEGVDSVFETSLLKPIIDKIKMEADNYNKVSGRIITDHIRAVVFLIGDGVAPSNEGRGYVVRRLIRRAVREGKKIGYPDAGLWKLTSLVIDIMSSGYPVLLKRADHIASVCKMEEESFLYTLEAAMHILDGYITDLKESQIKELDAICAFKLYDTYGMPIDITKNILEERGLKVDEDGFEKLIKERSRTTRWKNKETGISYSKEVKNISQTEFVGYEKYIVTAKVIKILTNQKAIVLNSTPMYPEAGGQIGDSGEIKGKCGVFKVLRTIKVQEGNVIIHEGKLQGEIKEGETVEVIVDMGNRKPTERNHTATHILQSVLRSVLGSHVSQSGSLVTPERLRFDFTHTEPLTDDQIKVVEDAINDIIMKNLTVESKEMDKRKAEAMGALSFFQDKYSDKVRAVSVLSDGGRSTSGGRVSMELCGGTHLKSTGEIGLFKIVSESGISAGVRRIEALTGAGALEFIHTRGDILKEVSLLLNTPEEKAVDKVEKLKNRIKELNDKVNTLENKIASDTIKTPHSIEKIGAIEFIKKEFGDVSVAVMRRWADSNVLSDNRVAFAVGCSSGGSKVSLILKISENLTHNIDAGKIMNDAAKSIGGSGGGRKDMASGGGNDFKSIKKAEEIIKKYLINSGARSSAG